MKKILGTLLLGLTLLTGCVDSNNGYEELKPFLPGLNLYQNCQLQTTLALQPANVGMRLAILLAEVDKQAATGETTDFGSVTYENKNVKEQLFGSSITITKSNLAGDYKVTFTTDSRVFGCYFSGSLTVKTGNTPLAETSLVAPWRVEMTDYEAQVDQGSGYRQAILFNTGETLLYANGDGSYTVSLAAMDMNVKDTQIHSEWSGSYRLRPEANGLAYSECSGKAFTVDGSFGGPSIFSLTSSSQTMQATKMSHQLSNGKYLFAGQVLTGTIVARLTGINDYNASYYVSPEVKVTWSYDEEKNSLSQKVEYNGQTM